MPIANTFAQIPMKMRTLLTAVLALISTLLVAQKYQVVVDTLGYESGFRGMYAVNNKVCWVTGSNGTVGRTTDGGITWKFQKVLDSTRSEIRDVQAWDENNAIILSVKDPAQILKTSDGGKTWKAVYTATNFETFLNGFAFWDRNKGIAFGDPVHGHFEILNTTDGGDTWQAMAPEHCPKATKEEAGFAASGTSICVGKKGNVWFVTGGNASHVFLSHDYGATWKHHETHMTHGISSKGIMSIVFMDDKNGVAVGGDFTAADVKEKNYSVTNDGGLTWHIPDKHQHPNGYRSCVEFITKNTIIAVGKNGVDISYDGGYNWEVVSHIGFLTIDEADKGSTIFVAGTNVVGRLIPLK
jgi:photosystem II stability/assembly factor-like uncharacterized protein